MEKIAKKIRAYMHELNLEFIETLHHLHENPETAFSEYNTTSYIKDKLQSFGIEILDIGLETGVIGLLKGSGDGPCIGLRADIDALPIQEESTCPYPSKKDGLMHACGHDIHTASLLGACHILSLLKDEIKGSVKFIFQPAEEINLGAKKLMELNCLENPKVDSIWGIHNSPEIPQGTVAVVNGPIMASVDRITFHIKGKGGHGGIPQRNADPIVAAAAIIQAVQTIVSRNISPLDPSVISICNVRAGEGTTNNVTPEDVTMYGTVRTFNPDIQHLIERKLTLITESISEAYGCTGEFTYLYELPVTKNNEKLYKAAYDSVCSIGAAPVNPPPSTGGEDFSIYTTGNDVPGFFYWLGVRNEEKDCIYPWHSPHFKADENCIAIGAGTYAMSVFQAINVNTKP